MAKRPIRVVIADDQTFVRQTLALFLERHGLDVVGQAATGHQALEVSRESQPDVLLLDLAMPDMDGFEVLSAVQHDRPRLKVLVFTSQPGREHSARAIVLGASAYLTKDADTEDILRSIEALMRDDAPVFDEAMVESAVNFLAGSSDPTLSLDSENGFAETLTPQEARVLALMGEGLNNEAIAKLLSLSTNTVKTHVRHIYEKLGVSDRTQAAIWAVRQSLA